MNINKSFDITHKKVCAAVVASTLMVGATLPVQADIQQLIDAGAFNELETQAAIAALSTYDRLIENEGCFDSFSSDPGEGQGSPCTGQTYILFSNVREIIHTANELTNDGPTAESLGADLEGLGFALRWTAGEEYAAQGSLSSDFVGGQVSSVATRLTALRAGARGFSVIGVANSHDYNDGLATATGVLGSGASADGDYGRWGGFINYDFGNGDREATGLEDAFDFDNSQITLGMDYRVNDRWIVGMVLGISEQELDFDGSQSIVEGGMEAEGTSLMPFVMYQQDSWFVSTSLGLQQMTFDTERAIRYPAEFSSVNALTVSSTDADMTSLFVETGYTFQKRKFAFEPFVNFKYSDINVDEFIEDDVNDDAFDLVVQSQNINSLEYTLGAKIQYTFTPSFGVFIPYLTVEIVNQTDDAPRVVKAYYAQDSSGETAFNVPTEALDSSYFMVTYGVSSVIRGGRQSKAGGSVGGDIQAFINHRSLQGLEGYTSNLYSLGIRYTF